jgi:imidazolonepropionase
MTSGATAVGATSLVTCGGAPTPAPAAWSPEVTPDGVVAWEGETVVYAGARAGWTGPVDAWYEGATIVPGFVDCHTHLPFVGWRDDEFEARLGGQTYRDLHGRGGIPRSAAMLAEASDEEVLSFCRPLAGEMLAHGTTAVELKTGYGLSMEAELRQARLARRLADDIPQTATVTLLACHAVPPGLDRERWVEVACRELIPAAAAEGLADAVDVYVEDIAFSVDDLRRVAAAAGEAGLALRCHADQLGPSGAAEAAAELGARSADHLNHVSPGGVRALGGGGTVAGLLPASTFLLRSDPPPVAALVSAGAAMAVATDCNPGTSAVASMPEAVAMACSGYGLLPLQALAAVTVNPAWVLGLHDGLGSLEPGKRADLVVLDGPFRTVPYRPGHNPVLEVVCGGRRPAGPARSAP